MTILLAFLLFLIAVATAWHFSAKSAEKKLTRRIENEQLKHDAMLRQEERQSAYAGRVRKS